jgi:hypothetical protein
LGKSEVDADTTQVNAYGELPENAKSNETDAFGEEEGECTFEFGDDGHQENAIWFFAPYSTLSQS